MGMVGSDTGAKAKGAKRSVLRDVPGLSRLLCADTPKCTAGPDWPAARIEESARPEPQGVGRAYLSRHLPSESVLGPMQYATIRIDS